jgi:hypothetical protein
MLEKLTVELDRNLDCRDISSGFAMDDFTFNAYLVAFSRRKEIKIGRWRFELLESEDGALPKEEGSSRVKEVTWSRGSHQEIEQNIYSS